MEQKQLDEMNDSYLDEEFIDEDDFLIEKVEKKMKEDDFLDLKKSEETLEELDQKLSQKLKERRLKKTVKLPKPAPAVSKKNVAKRNLEIFGDEGLNSNSNKFDHKIEKTEVYENIGTVETILESKEIKSPEVKVETYPLKEPKIEFKINSKNNFEFNNPEPKLNLKKEEKKEQKSEPKVLAKTEKIETKKEAIVLSAPVDPWADEKENSTKNSIKNNDSKTKVNAPIAVNNNTNNTNNNNGVYNNETDDDLNMLGKISVWKAFTGVALILLVFSVLTQGFSFSGNSLNSAAVLSLPEAENKVLNFVNTELLQEPFVAELASSEDTGSLYKMTLTVADQNVDSYVTKDGTLFFPQGFNLNEKFVMDEESSVTEETAEETVEEVIVNEEVSGKEVVTEELVGEEIVINSSETEIITETVPETVPTGEIKEFTLQFKKWSFVPERLAVQKGDLVKLTIIPDNTNPAFALSTFTFSIPDLSITKEVSGKTIIEFTADKVGTFEFKCGSCDEWRGMNGELVVE